MYSASLITPTRLATGSPAATRIGLARTPTMALIHLLFAMTRQRQLATAAKKADKQARARASPKAGAKLDGKDKKIADLQQQLVEARARTTGAQEASLASAEDMLVDEKKIITTA